MGASLQAGGSLADDGGHRAPAWTNTGASVVREPRVLPDPHRAEFWATGCTGRPAYPSCAHRRAASDRRS
jgi:hypothetical protein